MINLIDSESELLFSIIIPVYNTEKYLEKCIASCLSQTIDKNCFEIIIVNDGSTDKSVDIIENYRSKNSMIHVIHQQNKGLSQARNVGITHVRGRYVWFLDSDDWIEENSLMQLYSVCVKLLPDIVAFGAKNFSGSLVTKERSLAAIGETSISGKKLLEMNSFKTCSTFYLYSIEFLQKNELRFLPNIYHEDVEFVPRALFFAESVFPLYQNLYCVNEREGSITRSYIPKKSDDLLVVADSLIKFFDISGNTVTKKVRTGICTRISTTLNSALNNVKDHRFEFENLVREISKNNLYVICFMKSRSIKHKIEGALFFSPKIFIFFYQFGKKKWHILF